jgi:hypothetical protein
MRSNAGRCGFFLVLIAAAGLSGCGGKSGGAQKSEFAGTWLQSASRAQSQGPSGTAISPTELTHRVKLTFNADGTYTSVICAVDGKPLEPAETATGKWVYTGDYLDFPPPPASSNHGATHPNGIPRRSAKIELKSAGAQQDVLEIKMGNGDRVRFERGA